MIDTSKFSVCVYRNQHQVYEALRSTTPYCKNYGMVLSDFGSLWTGNTLGSVDCDVWPLALTSAQGLLGRFSDVEPQDADEAKAIRRLTKAIRELGWGVTDYIEIPS